MRRLFQQVEDHFGGLDIFVSNARPELSTFYQPPLELPLDSLRMALDSQAAAFLVGTQESSRLMRAGGRILAVTYAPSARTGSWQPWVAMGAGKAALEALVRYFAVALARRGITVNAIGPGLTEDSVLRGLPHEVQQATHAWHADGWTPMGRLGRPSDIGNAVALMCSEHASWITGQTIHVDGGASLMDTAFLIRQQIGQLLERSSRSRRTDLQDTTRVPALRRHPALSQIASGMTPEELLTTTRSVRRRLDLTRPVPRELILECIDIATQAPTGSNRQGWQWVIVTDAEKRKFIGERYREAWYAYAAGNRPTYEASDPRAARQERVRDSAMYLADHMGEVPALAIACHQGRVDGGTNLEIAGLYGSILPAVWSFMLAGRLRGLGTAYTTLHLKYEQEIAQLLSIPYAEMTQAAMLPVAY